MWCQNNTRLILYMGAVKISEDIIPRYIWFDGLVVTIVCRSYVIGHKFINPIFECGVKQPPEINPKCGQMDRPCPEVYNNI